MNVEENTMLTFIFNKKKKKRLNYNAIQLKLLSETLYGCLNTRSHRDIAQLRRLDSANREHPQNHYYFLHFLVRLLALGLTDRFHRMPKRS